MLVHFNAHSVLRKWDELCADMSSGHVDIYCISEFWVRQADDLKLYPYGDFAVFGNCRPFKLSGGVLCLVKPTLWPVLCTASTVTSSNNAFNDCTAKLSNSKPQTTVPFVYLIPGASETDVKALYALLHSILASSGSYLIVGDFNCPLISPSFWSLPIQPCYSGAEGELVQFIHECSLLQLNLEPFHLDNTLTLPQCLLVCVQPRCISYPHLVGQIIVYKLSHSHCFLLLNLLLGLVNA